VIELNHIAKTYHARSGPSQVLKDINLVVAPGDRLGVLGRNGAGKSTLIRIISGAEMPTSGTIECKMKVSWPLAFADGFQGSLTGLDNFRFICRIYGSRFESHLDFLYSFTELGKYLKEPVRTYSTGMRARLAFAISLAIEFDCYLIDEVIAVGDKDFQKKCHVELFQKRADRAFIFVSHDESLINTYCRSVAVLQDGVLSSPRRLTQTIAQ
jgi:capsular polysaccharide transport system ATP-binding protein